MFGLFGAWTLALAFELLKKNALGVLSLSVASWVYRLDSPGLVSEFLKDAFCVLPILNKLETLKNQARRAMQEADEDILGRICRERCSHWHICCAVKAARTEQL